MKKKNQIFKSKVAKYSVLAGAALTMVTACSKEDPTPPVDPNDADIDETDVDPDISLQDPGNNQEVTMMFDINNDGIDDIEVGIGSYNYSYYGNSIDVEYAQVDGLNGTQVLTSERSFSFDYYDYYYGATYTYTDTLDIAKALAEGDNIGPTESDWVDYGFLRAAGDVYGTNVNFGGFVGQDKYVGLKLNVAGATHYAWLRLSLSADGKTVTIKEHAYRVTPDVAIEAGDI